MKTASIWMVMALGTTALIGCGDPARTAPATKAPEACALPPATAIPAPVAAAPTIAPAPAPLEPARALARPAARAPSETKLVVKRLVVAEGVKNHEPVAEGTTFSGDKKIYAFVEVENRGREEGEILVEFEPPDGSKPHGDVTLAVGPSPRWRTWAYTRTAHAAGSWTAVVKNRSGEVLARKPFEVTL